MMEIDPPPPFNNKDDEIQYWMDLAQQLHQRKDDVERELEEFQENSQMLEKELEASLEQTDKTNRELRQRNSRLVSEVEQLRSRLDQQSIDCSMFQSRAQELQIQNNQLLKYVRELEQKNDDLERAHRVSKVTEEEMEAKFNVALEKTALLESELDEKESLRATVQRLKDEIRDLKQEIQVQVRHQPDNDKSAAVERVRNHVDSNKLQFELETHTPPTSPISTTNVSTSTLKIGNGVGGMIGNNINNNVSPPSLTPCTRILAMNMIGDLMRKVGALENKLNTCRNASSREDQTVRDLYRTRRQPRVLTTAVMGNNNHIRY
ncbi:PREDICTED: nuclear distribution protein nudE-like 1-B [Ceratosolen solmsi marchali]|uniref:Nuclear distribution protein nudE-like 1-B n=1 Tax=Ceratosolen solmsi marchali TaxID=326594 RepID=A0AAJ7E0I3_9HYME|nr:PREDICTED: nuclear distribution protein nudE-like 1-B [Ceratosolen solmsi marchali]